MTRPTGAALLFEVRGNVARNYRASASRPKAFEAAKRDVWLLTMEVDRLTKENGVLVNALATIGNARRSA
jgi:hypothetical protein